jgi:hypothetical protein
MRGGRFLLVATIVAAIALTSSLSVARSQPTNGDCAYFPETDHYVCDEFLEFFETRGGLGIFGYPLTEAFDDSTRGLRVQYLQRARMEFHPYNPEPYHVQLGLLGDELGFPLLPPSPAPGPAFNNSLRHYFPETGHVVSHSFLRFFREHGGLDIFGYPLSEFMYEDGLVVQYFQRARMEWHPDESSGAQIRLTNLGEIYLEQFGIPGDHDELSPQERMTDTFAQENLDRVKELEIDASVQHVITGRQGVQTIFVYVTDQREQPIPGAIVSMTVRYPLDEVRYEYENPTDGEGFTKHAFDIKNSPPGRNVVIDVIATYDDLTSMTQTFYLPWW